MEDGVKFGLRNLFWRENEAIKVKDSLMVPFYSSCSYIGQLFDGKFFILRWFIYYLDCNFSELTQVKSN